jgi:GNAT superfamily N-acetyltransferase
MLEALYEHQSRAGGYPLLKSDGARRWLEQLRPLLGSYAMLYCAGEERAEAFLSLRVKTYPTYLDLKPRASIGECYVEEAFRGQGVGRNLFKEATSWCAQKGLGELELQTTNGNTGAESFWEELGFEKELTQWKRNL